MKKLKIFACIIITSILVYKITPVIAKQIIEAYVLEHEAEIALQQQGTHNGGGITTGYNFFSKTQDLKLVFKKRILKPGSAIGYHLQKEDEIYYVLDGEGEMQMNGKTFNVKTGDAILTRPGSSHGLKVIGDKDLTIIINYEKN
jgi:mannose-6-phosphate isomerase-like protein (cupin superfamily)